jgi:PEP-CTERM motif
MTPLRLLAAAALMAGVAAPASALSITGSCGTASGPTELGGAAGAFSCTLFDSTLGTLNSMSLEIQGSITGSITLQNGSNSPQNMSGTTQVSFVAGALAGFSLASPLFTASFGTGLQSVPAGATVSFGPLNASGSTAVMLNNTNLAPYQAAGGGLFGVSGSTLSGLSISGGGGFGGGSNATSASLTAAVSYEYDAVVKPPIPEPGTWALAVLGLVGLGWRLRQRG